MSFPVLLNGLFRRRSFRDYMEEGGEQLTIFPSPRSYMRERKRERGGAWIFSKSQSLYGSVRPNTTYFFIFLNIFDIIFLYIFHIFLHIFHIFLHNCHISVIKNFPNVTLSKGWKGGSSRILKLPPRSRAGNFSTSSGRGGGGETCKKMLSQQECDE